MKWYGPAFAVLGALAAIRAPAGASTVVLAVTAAVAGGLSTVAVCTGAWRIRRRGEPVNPALTFAGLPTFCLAGGAVAGWPLSGWQGCLAIGVELANGMNIGAAGYALWRHRRLRRLALATQ